MRIAIEEMQAAQGSPSAHSGDRIIALTLSLLETERQNLRLALGFRSLFLFKPTSRFRKRMFNLITNVWFDRTILAVILCNSVILGFYDPLCIGHNDDFDPSSLCSQSNGTYVCDIDTISEYSCRVFCAGWAPIEKGHTCSSNISHGMEIADIICSVRHRIRVRISRLCCRNGP
jgi:hypothetical protein